MSQNPLFDNVYAVAGDENDAYKAKLTGYIKKGLNPRYDWNIYKQEMLDLVESYPMIRNFRFNVVREDSFTYDIIDVQVKGPDYSAVKDLAEEIRNYTAALSNIQNPRLVL